MNIYVLLPEQGFLWRLQIHNGKGFDNHHGNQSEENLSFVLWQEMRDLHLC